MQQWSHFSPKERLYIGELDKFLLNIKLSSIEAKAEMEGGEQIFLEQKIVFLPLTEAKAEKEGGVKRSLSIAAAADASAASRFKSTKSFQV